MSEYLRQLIRDGQTEQAREALEVAVLQGLDSGEPTPLIDEGWEETRREIRERHAARNRP